MKPQLKYTFFILSLIAVAVVFYFFGKEVEGNENMKLINSFHDQMYMMKRDARGREIVREGMIQSNTDMLLELIKNDSLLASKFDMVGKHTTSAVYHEIRTTDTIRVGTTVSSVDSIWPVYRASKVDDWIDLNVIASKDSTSVAYSVTNRYTMWQELKREKFLGPKEPIVHIRNENPHTSTSELKSWAVQTKRPRKLLWFGTGIGVGIIGGIMLMK